MENRSEIVQKLKQELSPERFEHSLRAEKIAVKLARKYGVSVKKASIAALLHDCARRYDRPGLLKYAKRLRFKINPIYAFEPKLLHADLSARIATKEYGIHSEEILRAIRHHTTGVPKMSRLEKIIFISDHIEEKRDYKGVNKIRALAEKNLDKAVVESATKTLNFVLGKKAPIDPATIATRNYYLLNG